MTYVSETQQVFKAEILPLIFFNTPAPKFTHLRRLS